MLVRNAAAFKPALHRRMISMAQLARHRPYAATRSNDFCVSHTHDVHIARTLVNVECVRTVRENAFMENERTTGEIMRGLRERSGLSVRTLAIRSGYSHGSGIQRFLEPDYDKRLTLETAQKLAEGFAGTSVKPEEVWQLAGLPGPPNAETMVIPGGEPERHPPQDVPVYGTALGGVAHFDSVAVEQTSLDKSDVMMYLKRPSVLRGRPDVYGVYVQGSSMSPRWEDGELVFVDPRRPAMIGDDVVLFLRDRDGYDGEALTCCLIKRIVKRTAVFVRLQQFSPAGEFDVPVERVARIHRVIPFSELFS